MAVLGSTSPDRDRFFSCIRASSCSRSTTRNLPLLTSSVTKTSWAASAPSLVPPLVVRLVLELEDGDAGLVTAPLARRPGQARRREDREQQGAAKGERRNALHDVEPPSGKIFGSPIVPRRNALLPSSPLSLLTPAALGASTTQIAAMFTMSLTSRPLWRTWTGLRHPQQDRPDRLGAAEPPDQLVGDVGRLQARGR